MCAGNSLQKRKPGEDLALKIDLYGLIPMAKVNLKTSVYSNLLKTVRLISL